jgi:hypothetical protein
MTDGDYYATYAQVRSWFNNANLGVSGSFRLDDTAIEEGLARGYGEIHLFLNNDTKLTNAIDLLVLKGIQVDMIAMQIKTIIALKLYEADSGAISAFYTISPELTRGHEKSLRRIRNRNTTQFNTYDTRNGRKLS